MVPGKLWGRWVQNRVEKIRANVPGVKWIHYPGKQNPADIPSRGLDISEKHNREIWLNGPSFLSKECATPDTDGITTPVGEIEGGSKAEATPEICMLTNPELSHGIGNVIDITRFSNLRKLFDGHVLRISFH